MPNKKANKKVQEPLAAIQLDLQKPQPPVKAGKQQHLQDSVQAKQPKQQKQQLLAEAAVTTDKPQPAQKLQTSPALLLVEAFAGSHAVGLHFTNLLDKQKQQQPQQPDYHLAAYAAIELEPKYKAPAPKEIGLQADNCLAIHASVSAFAVQSKVLYFVRSKLQDSSLGINAVVVFGGPPCTAYSQAKPHLAMSELNRLEESYQQALLNHTAQQRQLLAAGSKSSAAAIKAQETAAATASNIDDAIETAAAEAAQHARNLLASDSLVKSFLGLFKAIEVECQEYGKRHCYLVMENPYSQPDRALWNRDFMRKHLQHLPNAPAAEELPFRPLKQAWLRPVRQNWCTYGPSYPQKHNIIFTNLPEDVMGDRTCKDHCQRDMSNKSHAKNSKDTKGAHERAKWPVEFVAAALRACVEASQQ